MLGLTDLYKDRTDDLCCVTDNLEDCTRPEPPLYAVVDSIDETGLALSVFLPPLLLPPSSVASDSPPDSLETRLDVPIEQSRVVICSVLVPLRE